MDDPRLFHGSESPEAAADAIVARLGTVPAEARAELLAVLRLGYWAAMVANGDWSPTAEPRGQVIAQSDDHVTITLQIPTGGPAQFVPAERAVDAFRGAGPVDFIELRADLDRYTDQDGDLDVDALLEPIPEEYRRWAADLLDQLDAEVVTPSGELRGIQWLEEKTGERLVERPSERPEGDLP